MWNPFKSRSAVVSLDVKPAATDAGTPVNDRYLLRGLVHCGPCGQPRVPALDDGRRVYACTSARCLKPLASAEEIEQLAWAKVTGLNRDAVSGITRHGRRAVLVAVLKSVTTTGAGPVFRWRDR
jgi:hypothetical protein